MKAIPIFLSLILLFSGCISETTTTVKVTPQSITVLKGQSFNVNITCIPNEPVAAFEFKVSFNRSLLYANSVLEGDIFSGHQTFFVTGTTNGTIKSTYGLIVGNYTTNQSGSLVKINFTALETGVTTIRIYDVGICNRSSCITSVSINGIVKVV